jgi:hypothetical protein
VLKSTTKPHKGKKVKKEGKKKKENISRLMRWTCGFEVELVVGWSAKEGYKKRHKGESRNVNSTTSTKTQHP